MPPKTQSRKPDSEPQKRLHLMIVKQMLTLVTSGFGLVAALAWNNVIQEFVNSNVKPFLPQGSSLLTLGVYATVVTAIAVLITFLLARIASRLEK